MAPTSRPNRVTIADVAREAAVSRTTVSHALNGLGKVNPQTREKVKEVAERLNYRPSARARGLRSGRSKALALLSSMPSAVSAGPSRLGFFTELAMGCARTALLNGYVFVLAPPDGDSDPVGRLDIDGAILLEPDMEDPLAAELTERGIPFVTIGGPLGANSIDLHHVETAELIVGHLLERGSNQPALIVGTSSRMSQQAALAAYLEASEQAGFDPIIAEVAEAEGEDGSFRAARTLLADHPEIDGMFVPIDAFASGAVRAGTEAGRVIGSDLLLATRYDGLRARTSTPPLTAVDLHLDEVSSAAVQRMIGLLDDATSDTSAGIVAVSPPMPTLVVRESTGG